jgi:putative endonuclease
VKLIWAEHIPRLIDAIAAERRIKGWTRAKKQALIRGDWDRLRQLAKRGGGSPR